MRAATDGRHRGRRYRSGMEIILMLLVIVLVLAGPLAYFWGTDSRRVEDRGWFGSRRPN